MKKVLLALLVLVSFISCSTSTSGSMEKTQSNENIIDYGTVNGRDYEVVYKDIPIQDGVTPTVAYGEKIGNTTYIFMVMDVRIEEFNQYMVNITAQSTSSSLKENYWNNVGVTSPNKGNINLKFLNASPENESGNYMYMALYEINETDFNNICNSSKLDVDLYQSSRTIAQFTPNEKFCQAVAKYVKK